MTDDFPGWLQNFRCHDGVHFFIGSEPVCTCGSEVSTDSSARFDRRSFLPYLESYMEFNFGVLPEWAQAGCIVEYRRGNEVTLYKVVDRQGDRLILTSVYAATPPGPYGLLAGYKPAVQAKPDEVEILAHARAKAIEAGASHISADGKTGYRLRMGNLEYIRLDSSFPTWWETVEIELPAEAVEVK